MFSVNISPPTRSRGATLSLPPDLLPCSAVDDMITLGSVIVFFGVRSTVAESSCSNLFDPGTFALAQAINRKTSMCTVAGD